MDEISCKTIEKLTRRASALTQQSRLLASGIAPLDRALGGGLAFGTLAEWGLPPGRQGLRILLQFFLRSKPLVLWVSSDDESSVYPPAWAALGIELKQMYFVCTQEPLRQLQPVFFEPVFEVIVLHRPGYLSPGDFAFLAQQARKMRQLIIITRPYFLHAQKGNAHMRVRANAYYEFSSRRSVVHGVKGTTQEQVVFDHAAHAY
jgi:hypothetical protein